MKLKHYGGNKIILVTIKRMMNKKKNHPQSTVSFKQKSFAPYTISGYLKHYKRPSINTIYNSIHQTNKYLQEIVNFSAVILREKQ